MRQQFNPWDLIIGFGFGVSLTLLILRLASIVDTDVSLWGQVILVPAMLLGIARQLNQAPFVTKGRDSDQRSSND